jgi:hypothetical protein
MPLNESMQFEYGPSRAGGGRRALGPKSLPSPDVVGAWEQHNEIGELASRQSGVPSHRKPGAAKKAVSANSTSRTDAAHLD